MTKRAAIYARVSTKGKGQTTENQKIILERYCKQRDFEITGIFEDKGISGSKSDRPALNELMKQARQRKFDVVLVWKFDRFARSVSHLLQALQEFKDLNIDFISISEGIDTSTAMGKMVFTFLGAIAEFERNLITERVRAGIQRAKSEGKHCGRPKKAFDTAKAQQLHNRGYGCKRIARELGNVSSSTVFNYLKGIQKAS